jgi:hypothetical protein
VKLGGGLVGYDVTDVSSSDPVGEPVQVAGPGGSRASSVELSTGVFEPVTDRLRADIELPGGAADPELLSKRKLDRLPLALRTDLVDELRQRQRARILPHPTSRPHKSH